MSAFFEQSWKLGLKVEDMCTDELVALYDRHGPHDATRTWFHDNLTRPFGLSVDALDLASQPVRELTAHKRRFLFMKYEDQSPWEQALSRFAGTDIVLKRRNDSARKAYFDDDLIERGYMTTVIIRAPLPRFSSALLQHIRSFG